MKHGGGCLVKMTGWTHRFAMEMAVTDEADQQRVPLNSKREFTSGLTDQSERKVIPAFVDRGDPGIDQTVREAIKTEFAPVVAFRRRLAAHAVACRLDMRHLETAAPAGGPVAQEDDALDSLVEVGA